MSKELKTDRYKFFQHRTCEYFPCHPMENLEDFNCLFCYCPLYALGKDCGGNYTISDKGVKNCTNCCFPHDRQNYDRVIQKLTTLLDRMKPTGLLSTRKDQKKE
jgi:Zn-finger protein